MAIDKKINIINVNRCETCNHYKICKFSEDKDKIVNKINEMLDNSKDIIFSLSFNCKEYQINTLKKEI